MVKKRARGREATFYSDSVVLHGDSGITVYGCRRILHYSPTRICLQAGKRQIRIEGKDLLCTAFSAGSVKGSGEIGCVCFCRAECRTCRYDEEVVR